MLLPNSSISTVSRRRPLSYRNQSIDSHSKSMNWFLYENGLRHERFNKRDRKEGERIVQYVRSWGDQRNIGALELVCGIQHDVFSMTYATTTTEWGWFVDVEETQPVITCSKLTIETLEQGVKYVQSSSISIVNFEPVNAGWKTPILH